MIICFSCGQETKRILDELLATGGYADYADAIAAAVANQAVLTERLGSAGALVIPSEPHGTSESPHTSRVSEPSSPTDYGKRQTSIPDLFVSEQVERVPFGFPSPPKTAWGPNDEIPASDWLWGQYNRFLPAKVSCRALAKLQRQAPSGVLLSDASVAISKAAGQLGDLLTARDRKMGLKREDAIATAFPHNGADSWKGQQRYASQFVGSVNGDGKVSGMLADLKLYNWEGRSSAVKLHLTEAGWAFAHLHNPILDGGDPQSGKRLSNEEIDFLIVHIQQSVPQEDFAYRFVLRAVDVGLNRPDQLDGAVADANRSMKAAFVSTQRSGVVARMADLGLLERMRSGLSVTYGITSRGRDYLKSSASR